jgi:hypothetical protein
MIDQKQVDSVEYFKCFGSMTTDDARCTREIKSSIARAKAAFKKNNTLFISKQDSHSRKKLAKCYIWSIALYSAETGTLRKADKKCVKSFEMWCRRRTKNS